MSTLDKLKSFGDNTPQFGKNEELSIISLALDHPEFFISIGRFMHPEMFQNLGARWVIAELLNMLDKYGVVPTRAMLRDKLESSLTLDDPYEEVLSIVDRPSDPREVPIIKDTLLQWAKDRAYGMIYGEEAQEAYANHEYDKLEDIIQQAHRIADVGQRGFWFFEQYHKLFEPECIDHRTTGFPRLDKVLNDGGPSKKEVICWMAGTNVGKSLVLCNNAITSYKGIGNDGAPGQDVLLITFELDMIKTAMRCLGAATDIPLSDIAEHRGHIDRVMAQLKRTYNKRFAIHELQPEECSVDHIYALLDSLKRTDGWHPDVIIIDYLDLMMSRNQSYNVDDYSRQKHVANEIRGLAKSENVLVFTATQTNRSGVAKDVKEGPHTQENSGLADLDKVAESYAKQFSLDYIVSLNQTSSQQKSTPPRLTMFVAKNRNGPKHTRIECTINYNSMLVKEVL